MEQLLENAFIAILNMSITASYVILFVIIARMLLKKAPKIFSYCLWATVWFRLVCPVSFSSTLSFLGLFGANRTGYVPVDIGMMPQPQINVGMNNIDQAINRFLPAQAPYASVNPMQILIYLATIIWALGMIVLLVYSVASYLSLRRKVSTAMLVTDNIYESEHIRSPFVLGLIKPRIYLPIGIAEGELSYILKHEQTHIQRFDHLIKPLSFFVLCLHWYNPLVWLAFVLMNKDMEMSCDERVLSNMGESVKKNYSGSLLSFATGRKVIGGCPLAFGESNTKSRIVNVLNYKRPAFWALVISVIIVTGLGVSLVANPVKNDPAMAWAKNLNAENIQSIEVIALPNSDNVQYANLSPNQFDDIVNAVIINKGKHLESLENPEALFGSTVGIYITTTNGFCHTIVNNGNVYLEIDGNYYDGMGKLEKNFPEIETNSAIPAGFWDRVQSGKIFRMLNSGKKTGKQSTQDEPNNGVYTKFISSDGVYCVYEKSGRYYVEKPYEFISEISTQNYMNLMSVNRTTVSQANSSPIIHFNGVFYTPSVASLFPTDLMQYTKIGQIQSITDSDRIPTEDNQANIPILGAEIYDDGRNIIVSFQNNITLYEPMPAERTEPYEKIINELSVYPAKFPPEDAVKAGLFVVTNGIVKSDPNMLDSFIATAKAGNPAALTSVQYTHEGDPLFIKLIYDGLVYYGVEDDSRDAFRGDGQEYTKFQYKYLKVFEHDGYKNGFLLNDETITYEQIQHSLTSSQSTDWIECFPIFFIKQ